MHRKFWRQHQKNARTISQIYKVEVLLIYIYKLIMPKINIYKSVAFLYTNNKLSEGEMKKATPL